MNDYQKIIQNYESIDFSKNSMAMATLVKLYGSSYRRPGARMLISEDGKWTGAISGGCLEGDALRKARKIMQDKKPMLIRYDTMQDEDALSLGVGLGCNGIIDVLIEVIDKEENNLIDWLKETQEFQEASALATIFQTNEEDAPLFTKRCMLLPNGEIHSNLDNPLLQDRMLGDMKTAMENKKSMNVVYSLDGIEMEVFIEAICPSIQLIVFGAGFDTIPLVQIAKNLGWNVWVTDDCPAHIQPKRFATADQLKAVDRNQIIENIPIYEHTACVLMSHNYQYDFTVLKQLLKTNTDYIGLLGPKKKFERMQKQMLEEGKGFTEEDLRKIYNPIGLDIGGETPEEIALSIIAEIQAKFKNKPANFLKNKDGFIHDR